MPVVILPIFPRDLTFTDLDFISMWYLKIQSV